MAERAFLIHADGILIGTSDLERCEDGEEEMRACLLEGEFEPTPDFELVRSTFKLHEQAESAPRRERYELRKRYLEEREGLNLTIAPRRGTPIEDCVIHIGAARYPDSALTIHVTSHGDVSCAAWGAARASRWVLAYSEAWRISSPLDPLLPRGTTHPPAAPAPPSPAPHVPKRVRTLPPPPPPALVRAAQPAAEPREADIFVRMPFLLPPETWHPDAPAMVEEARQLDSILDGDLCGLEIWARLGMLTHPEVRERLRSKAELSAILYEETHAGWPIVARCLLRIASADVPGRFCAALHLLELVDLARRRDLHRGLFDAGVEDELVRWQDDVRRPLAAAIAERVAKPPGSASYLELVREESFADAVARAEMALG